ncbi:MAG: hypothetical protein JOZ74_14800 [Bradyrhizobium sp.]|nr:hypothetical protein [Bradyrhizobium sp.]
MLIASVLACTAVAVSIGLAYPTPVSNPALGADWRCLRSVGIVTTCRRVSHAQPMSHRLSTQPGATRQA